MSRPGFQIRAVEYPAAESELRAVRERVFVEEQKVPLELEMDELDAVSFHVIAHDARGRAIGTGRLTPERRIGRMAVLAEWRRQGVGDALLDALLAEAARRGWERISLHAQVAAEAFYARHGFLPRGPRFVEAGIEHQLMDRGLRQANPVETAEQAAAALIGIAAGARRRLHLYSPALDPGLLDRPEVVAALRRLATAGGEIQALLHDVATPQRALAPLIGLAQRLPSGFAFRLAEDPVDLDYPSAYAVNDTGGWYFRRSAARLDGDTALDGPGRARQLRMAFEPVWERARPATELRALGL